MHLAAFASTPKESINVDRATFWHLIAGARVESEGDIQRQLQLLKERLLSLSLHDIQDFDWIVRDLRKQSYTRALWGAAYLINGGCSDDGFEYFRGWLIAQGHAVFHAALQDPDSLAEVLASRSNDEPLECEHLLYVASEVYEAATGMQLPEMEPQSCGSAEVSEWNGGEWTADELAARYPRLWALYGHLYKYPIFEADSGL